MREEVEDPVDKSDEFLPQIAGMVLAAEGAFMQFWNSKKSTL